MELLLEEKSENRISEEEVQRELCTKFRLPEEMIVKEESSKIAPNNDSNNCCYCSCNTSSVEESLYLKQ